MKTLSFAPSITLIGLRSLYLNGYEDLVFLGEFSTEIVEALIATKKSLSLAFNQITIFLMAQMTQKQNSKKHKGKSKYQRRSPGASQPEAESPQLRPVFAAYLNMARSNLYNVLCYISSACGIKIDYDEENMRHLKVLKFSTFSQVELTQQVFKMILKNIPVLQFMGMSKITDGSQAAEGKAEIPEHKTIEPEDIQEILLCLIEILNFKRNFFTHVDHYDTVEEVVEENRREQKLRKALYVAFMGSKRKVAKVFQYSAEEMFFVNQDERMERTEDKDDNGHNIYREYLDYYFRLYEQDGTLSTAGLIFLICKFLHKKYATQFIQKTGLMRSMSLENGYSPFLDRENEVMYNIFCYSRIRLPKGRLETESSTASLAFDMLSELQKCPKELFDALSPKDRKKFQVARREDGKVSVPDEDINLFRRNGDRFTQLALRYLDSFKSFNRHENDPVSGIVFQVALGKFRFKFYDRASIDTTEKNRVRVWQKEINGFGPLEIIEKRRKEKYKDYLRPLSSNPKQLYEKDTAQTRPYITDQRATYAITGERIGLLINDSYLEKGTQCFLPELPECQELKDGNGSSFWSVGALSNNMKPQAWLSIHDIPALVFLHLLGGNPSKVIKDTFKNLSNLFRDIAKGKLSPDNSKGCVKDLLLKKYHLTIGSVPKKVLDYLEGRENEDFDKWCDRQFSGNKEFTDAKGNVIQARKGLIKSLKDSIDTFEKKLKVIGTRDNRPGTKGYVDVRPGTLSRYLCKDIMKMTDIDSTKKNYGKPTGMDYAVLQSAIAMYRIEDEKQFKDTELYKMIGEAILDIKKHPFLSKLETLVIKDTIDLYRQYQKNKLTYYEQVRLKRSYKSARFLNEAYKNFAEKTSEYMQGLANRYLDIIQLPDGLFTDEIINLLKKNESTCDNEFVKALIEDERFGRSVTNLLSVYFEKVLLDEPQPFYKYKRHYKLFDTLYPADTSKKLSYLTYSELLNKTKKGKDVHLSEMRADINNHVESFKVRAGSKPDPNNPKKRIPNMRNPRDNERKEEATRLMHQYREMERNEKAIRRHRNNDILLFLMSTRLLVSDDILSIRKGEMQQIKNYRLQRILPPGCESEGTSIMSIPINIRISLKLVDEKGKPILDADGSQITRTISQNGIKLKNYGDFYSFLFDTRIGSLLSQLNPKKGFTRASLEKEFERYDNHRAEVFAKIQQIESIIISANPQLKDPYCQGFYADDGKPYRNNFRNLLSLCMHYLTNGGDATEVAKLLIEIRNAFSHNRYVIYSDRELNISLFSVPQVSDIVFKWLKNESDSMKKAN